MTGRWTRFNSNEASLLGPEALEEVERSRRAQIRQRQAENEQQIDLNQTLLPDTEESSEDTRFSDDFQSPNTSDGENVNEEWESSLRLVLTKIQPNMTETTNNGNSGGNANNNSGGNAASTTGSNTSGTTGGLSGGPTGGNGGGPTGGNGGVNTGSNAGGSSGQDVPTVTYMDVKDLVPRYDGNPAGLDCYIAVVDSLLCQLPAGHNRRLLTIAARAKLTSRAFDAIKTMDSEVNWMTIRSVLRQKIAPTTSESACQQLTNARQNDDETLTAYASRIEDLLNQLNRASTAGVTLEAARIPIKQNNARLAQKTFEYGLRNRDIRTITISAIPGSLNAAIQTAMELDATGRFKQDSPRNKSNAQHNNGKQSKPTCNFCKKKGHKERECWSKKSNDKPQQQAASTSSSPKTCNYCKKPGHLIAECRKKKASDQRNASGQSNANSRRANVDDAGAGEPGADTHVFTLEELRKALSKQKND